MKASRYITTLMAAALATVGFNAYAFHSGGVAECEGCHSMHAPKSTQHLLVGSDASSSCLSCHRSADTAPNGYHVATADFSITPSNLPVEKTPGGDFAWLLKTYTWAGEGGIEEGQSHGHNIIATDYEYKNPDSELVQAPGGTYAASDLACNSCHDPHSKARRNPDGTIAGTGAQIYSSGSYGTQPDATKGAVGIYRLLWTGVSPDKATAGAGANYVTYPVAIAPSTYNRSEGTTQTRVAYGGGASANGWGSWCGSCHGDFNYHDKKLKHPVDYALTSEIVSNYNAYMGSGRLTRTDGNSYSTLVPFAEGTSDFAALTPHANINNSFLNGPSSTSEVTCLSCHRAHASGFADMLRYYYSWEFMTYDGKYPGLDNTSMTSSRKPVQASGRNMIEFQIAYYDRTPGMPDKDGNPTINTYNRVLCNKCHAQD